MRDNLAKPLTVLFLLRRIGPYHHARFQELANKVNLIAAETRPTSVEYPWNFKVDQLKYAIVQFALGQDPEVGLRRQPLKTEVRLILAKHKPDVVVTTGWADPEYHVAILEATSNNIPRVLISDSRLEDEPRVAVKEYVKRLILKNYSAALVAGISSSNYLRQLGFPLAAIFQPWDVVDNSYFNAVKQDYNYSQREFLCISRFIPKKNLLLLLEAFALYRANGGHRQLRILGSGEMESNIKLRIVELRLEEYVHLDGFIQYEVIPLYLAKAHCLILPSITDQWGLVVNEAMAAGLPVIVSSNCGCAKDLVKFGENGYTFDPANMNELGNQMKMISELEEEQWVKMSTASRMIIASWDVTDFAMGLEAACQFAKANPSKRIFKIIHNLLSH